MLVKLCRLINYFLNYFEIAEEFETEYKDVKNLAVIQSP